jgi:hypothetical protein
MVVLVPRQLRFTGMTGSVPYYGGRFTPAQAHAAAHRSAYPPTSAPGAPPTPAPTTAPRRDPAEALHVLERLRDRGLLEEEEYEMLRDRIVP